MDKVTQSNAASAEESAAAAQELTAHAEVMKQSVAELARLVGIHHAEMSTQVSRAGRGPITARTRPAPANGNGHAPTPAIMRR
jgi:methyl-accepting chemotaxis protein